jgi:hypothetical protein
MLDNYLQGSLSRKSTRSTMKHIRYILLSVVLLAGCAFNQYQSDVVDNQYNGKQLHADSSAPYIGEWTASSNVGIRAIKIKEDGRVKVCLSPSSGITFGKVYMDGETPAFIFQSGGKAQIVSQEKDILLLDIYGKEEKYYAGMVPDECKTAFLNF